MNVDVTNLDENFEETIRKIKFEDLFIVEEITYNIFQVQIHIYFQC